MKGYQYSLDCSGFCRTLITWGGVLGLTFAGYVPLASQNPYPIIVPGGYSHTLTIWVCAAGQGMVFRPSSLEQGI